MVDCQTLKNGLIAMAVIGVVTGGAGAYSNDDRTRPVLLGLSGLNGLVFAALLYYAYTEGCFNPPEPR